MDLDQEAAQRVGSTLCQKWTLERLIGTGGMAAVYVANHRIGRREAIKILHSDVAKDPELRARFEQEAHTVNRFRHPGAVEVRDIDVAEDGTPFLVMELLEGESLASIARRDGAAPSDLLRWADELLDVLVAAHAQGIIHRDIKPDNLFIQADGRLKVLDFGIARVRASTTSKPHTRAGEALGTATYMPPEQIHGGEIDGRADVFAVGATLFRLLAKRRIHEAVNEGDLLMKMGTLPAPRLCDVAPEVPRELALVVDRALTFDPDDRYPDARTMQLDVRAVREGRAPPYATAHAADPPRAKAAPSGAPPALAQGKPHAIPTLMTKAASPAALHTSGPETVDAQRVAIVSARATNPASSAAFVEGAALASPLAIPVLASASHVVHVAPPSPGPSSGLSDSTLRSIASPVGAASPALPVNIEVIHPTPRVIEPVPLPAAAPASVRGAALAPGESVRVVDPPPRPPRTLPGTTLSVWPLLLVGVVFASIGVGVTLFFMLRDAPIETAAPPKQIEQGHPIHVAPSPHGGNVSPTHSPTVHR